MFVERRYTDGAIPFDQGGHLRLADDGALRRAVQRARLSNGDRQLGALSRSALSGTRASDARFAIAELNSAAHAAYRWIVSTKEHQLALHDTGRRR